MKKAIKMGELDRAAVLLEDVRKNETVQVVSKNNEPLTTLVALDDIPVGNKIALVPMEIGTELLKYNSVIGRCTRRIYKGEFVHVHNVKSLSVDIPKAFRLEIMKQIKERFEE